MVTIMAKGLPKLNPMKIGICKKETMIPVKMLNILLKLFLKLKPNPKQMPTR
jgi:hypothetical protein